MLDQTTTSKFKLRQERLARLGALPLKKPSIPKTPPIEPHTAGFMWDCMWFYDLVLGETKRTITPRSIQIETAKYYGITHGDILSNRKTNNLVIPRQLAMYLTKILTPLGFAAIGRKFGGKDHSTVIHACLKMESLVGVNDAITSAFVKIKGAFV